jgi:ADP-ribosylglycohydrolase
LIIGAVQGREKSELLDAYFYPGNEPVYWQENPLDPKIAAVAAGSFKDKQPPDIKGSGFLVKSLEAALWAFYRSESFREGALLAVNLGDDADTTGAIYGQLAGATYGAEQIPSEWGSRVTMRDFILEKTNQLFAIAHSSP